jgi:transposase
MGVKYHSDHVLRLMAKFGLRAMKVRETAAGETACATNARQEVLFG